MEFAKRVNIKLKSDTVIFKRMNKHFGIGPPVHDMNYMISSIHDEKQKTYFKKKYSN